VDAVPGAGHYAAGVDGPHRFIVTWGRLGRFDFHAVEVEAWDPDDALVTAAGLHPELPRPRVAVLSTSSAAQLFDRRHLSGGADPDA